MAQGRSTTVISMTSRLSMNNSLSVPLQAPVDVAEEVDGSLSVTSGKEMAGGALSRFGSTIEGDA